MDDAAGPSPVAPGRLRLLLVLAILVAATAGLIYELIMGTVASYLLGDAVAQFSLAIGIFLAAMGLGSFLTRWIQDGELGWLIWLEAGLGCLGAVLAPLAFAAFAAGVGEYAALFGGTALAGVLVGMELPLVIRLVRQVDPLPAALGTVLAADYAGALGAAVLFPFVLLPELGLVRAGAVAGALSVAAAALLRWRLAPMLPARGPLGRRVLAVVCVGSAVWCAVVAAAAPGLVGGLHAHLYQDEVVFSAQSARAQVVVTRWRDDIRLYLDGHLQFSTVDEYRYHESLVHGALGRSPRPMRRVLVLGGGDGLAVREVLRRPETVEVVLVDLDPMVTGLFRDRPLLAAVNGGALADPRVTVVHTDAFRFVQDDPRLWDGILIDLPDPSEAALGKLYSLEFYSLCLRRLADGGVVATQATSPFRSREAFWCIARTLRAAAATRPGATAAAWHTEVPTFGTWGFAAVVAGPQVPPERIPIPDGCRFLAPGVLPSLAAFPPDMAEVDGPISTLDLPAASTLYRRGWHRYLE